MFERAISLDAVHTVLANGDTIAVYAVDFPYPTRLMLRWSEGRPLHVVAAYNESDDETIIVTVYEPDPFAWEPDFRGRKR